MTAPLCAIIHEPRPGWPGPPPTVEIEPDAQAGLVEESRPTTDELEAVVLDALLEESEAG